MKPNNAKPIIKTKSAILSNFLLCLSERIEKYENKQDMRKTILAMATNSSRYVSIFNFNNFKILRITKHKPRRLADVGNICCEMFLSSFIRCSLI